VGNLVSATADEAEELRACHQSRKQMWYLSIICYSLYACVSSSSPAVGPFLLAATAR
jgi:hypothetical protein